MASADRIAALAAELDAALPVLVRAKYLACRVPVRGELAAYSTYLARLAGEARKSQ